MGGTTRSKPFPVLVGLCALIAVGLFALLTQGSTSDRASAATDGAAMSLEVNGQTGKVRIDPGATFDVVVNADAIPLTNGYFLAAAWIGFGNELTLASSVTTWPDCNAADVEASPATGEASRACLTGLLPAEQFGSTHKGPLFTFTLTCTTSWTSTEILLRPVSDPIAGINGAQLIEFSTNISTNPSVSNMTVNCQPHSDLTGTQTLAPTNTPKPPDGDTDGDKIPNSSDPNDDNDACTDDQENGPDETLGGRRNPHNPNDFYDTNGDAIIDLTNDIFEVIQHYAPMGTEPTYDVNFDRGPSSGPNVWNMTAPDGVIDLTNDILGVILQYFHSCQ